MVRIVKRKVSGESRAAKSLKRRIVEVADAKPKSNMGSIVPRGLKIYPL
jgi:hypothetical protein